MTTKLITYRTPECIHCHEASEVDLPEDEFTRWQLGECIDQVWPNMSADWREQLRLGIHPECFDKIHGPEEDEDWRVSWDITDDDSQY